jgi:dihydropyrimidinase
MSNFDTIITNGQVVIPNIGIVQCDIAIKDGVIAGLLQPGSGVTATEVIDAAGNHVLPGAIDPHVHLGYQSTFEEQCEKDTRAAAIGGVTTMQIYTGIPDRERFHHLVQAGNSLSMIDFSISPQIRSADNATLMDEAVTEWGMTSFKFLMAYRGKEAATLLPGVPQNDLDDGLMFHLFQEIGEHRKNGHNLVACVHAENFEITDWYMRKLQAEGNDTLRAWSEASPGFAEAENAYRATYFGEIAECPVYIVHLGSKESVEAIKRIKKTNPNVYAETCPHYLARTCDDDIGNLGKISPPIRTKEDQDVVWAALADGTLDTVGTDNTGTNLANKQGTIWEAARGIPGIGTLLPIVLSEGVNKGRLSLERAVEVTSYNTAKIFNMYPKKGTIEVGSDADLVIVDMNLEKEVTPQLLQHYSDYNIYEGMILKGWPIMTMVRGTVIANNFEIVAPQGHGKYQPFQQLN